MTCDIRHIMSDIAFLLLRVDIKIPLKCDSFNNFILTHLQKFKSNIFLNILLK